METNKVILEEILREHSNVCIDDHEDVILAMKEACRQTLELAAENADIEIRYIKHEDRYFVDKQSILDTINQVE